jgi:Ca2+-binding EF-hand superfamily protein
MEKMQSDAERRRFAEQLFLYYDKDRSGFLEVGEMINLINDILENMKVSYKATREEVVAIVKMID